MDKKKSARKPAPKKAAPKKTASKKPVKRAAPKPEVSNVKEAYHKAIELVVKVNEMMVDGMDDRSIDEVLDEIAEQRKVLNGSKRNEVIGRLLKSLTAGVNSVEIDEGCTDE
jgi:3-oxoacyl-ACP reductase-like protein